MKITKKILLFAFLFILFPRFLLSTDIVTIDMNKDGRPDGWNYFTGGNLEKQEIDINYDGKVDSVYLYEGRNKIKEEILDTNYDGRMDNWRFYEDGNLVIDRIDSNLDGRIDIWLYVDRGRVYRIEKDTTGNGKPDQIINY